ncbi:MAG: MliC family protein [Syntrophales bacterium]
MAVSVLLAGCAGIGSDTLTVRPGERAVYRCEGGERIVARSYSLSDRSLDFVKVLLPDGREVTLPQALSASGVRYTDDREWVWWTKGDSAFAETRAPDGEWRIAYKNCRQTAEKR